MKVICIDSSARPDTPQQWTLKFIKEGNENGSYYLLGINYPGCGWAYKAYRFAPISERDEREFERNYDTVKL